METSSSVRFVLQLASQEAMASQHADIAPEHLFVAVLKFSDLDIDKIKDFVSKPDAGRELAEDLNVVRDVIREKSIRCPHVCHKLLAEIGKGNARFTGGVMHRSPDCKAFFQEASRLARDADSDRVSPVHLLHAMLSAPTDAMVKALAPPPASSEAKQTRVPESPGVSQTPPSPPEVTSYIIEAKALIQALAHPSRKSVVMFTQQAGRVQNVVSLTAKRLAKSDNCPDLLKRKRIVDVSHLTTDAELERALMDASREKGIILYTPPITSLEHISRQDYWVRHLERCMEAKTVQSISATTAAIHEDLIKHNIVWKTRVHPMWLRSQDNPEIPREL